MAEVASGEEMHAMEGADGHGGAHAEGEHHGYFPSGGSHFPIRAYRGDQLFGGFVAVLSTDHRRPARYSVVQAVPSGLQNFFELLVKASINFEEILGKHLVKQTFWFFATVFIYILTANWFGLIPGLEQLVMATPWTGICDQTLVAKWAPI